MSKPVKQLVKKEFMKRFEGLDSLAVVAYSGIDGVTTNRIRGRLRDKNIRLSVVKNSMARQAFDAIGLSDAGNLLSGPCAVAFGTGPDRIGVVEIVRELMDIAKEAPNLTVKAALLDGEQFGPDRIKALSGYPTRPEAIAKAVSCVLSPGGKLVGCLVGPGRVVASLVKAIQEKREAEGGEQAA